MKALVLAIVLVAACSGKSKQETTTAGGGSDTGSAILAKKVAIGFGVTQNGSSAQVFLQITDETGKQTSHPVGSYDGSCQSITPAPEMKALAGVRCTSTTSTGSTELHAVAADAEIVVLKLHVEDGLEPDPMAREEVTRVKVPPGAAILPAAQP